MKIIPAIDIMGQKVVRLEQGKFEKEKVYSENPVLTAAQWEERGAEILHIVDLDGARLGKPVNLDIVREIAANVKLDIELGGGLRTENDIEAAFQAGARFVVIGTSAATDEGFCRKLAEKYRERVIFAVDVKDGYVAIKGWKESKEEEAVEYVKRISALGAKKIIYTDISSDGMMQGPNLEVLKSILRSTKARVYASGGISSIEDIKTLKALEPDGLKGVIIGKALYEGKLKFEELLRLCTSAPEHQ